MVSECRLCLPVSGIDELGVAIPCLMYAHSSVVLIVRSTICSLHEVFLRNGWAVRRLRLDYLDSLWNSNHLLAIGLV